MTSRAERSLSEQEAAIVRWLLSNAAVADVSAYDPAAVSALRVVGGCDCGCASVEFAKDLHTAGVIADAVAVYPDGQEAGVLLFGRAGQLMELELFDMTPNASHRLPTTSDLRTYDQLGREAAANS